MATIMKKMSLKINALAAISAFLVITEKAVAQYDAMFTQYMFNEVFINPAYAGSKEAMSATMLHRQQWVSFPGRPVTTSFALHGPLMENKMGVGLSVLSEKIGVLTRNLIYGNYAYRVKIHEGGMLAMGLMGGIDNQSNKFSTLKLSDEVGAASDPQFSANAPNLLAANFGTGIYYNTKTFFAGLSVPRLLDNEVYLSYNGAKTIKVTRMAPSKFTYYFTAGNVFTLTEDVKLKTTGMLKAVKNAPAQLDVSANALINEMIWAGLSYRTNSSMSLLIGMQATKQLLVSYSYDYSLSKIQRYSQGSHEIAINYLFTFKGRQIVTPRYF
jgi:type IX secretion system PorP/SprF family membrane protein